LNHPIITRRRLLLFKWLMVFMPSVLVLVGHTLLGYLQGYRAGHSLQEVTMGRLTENLLVALFLLALVYIFVETLFSVLGRLQAEASAREQDIQTMNAVMQERARLSRELHDGAAQLVADLLLRLDTIKDLVEAGRSQEAAAEIERLHGVADEIYEDIGESIAGLRTNLMERGLIYALEDYVDQFEERHQILTSLRILTEQAPGAAGQPGSELARSEPAAWACPEPATWACPEPVEWACPEPVEWVESISPLAALQLFRFIQEALTNVRKHAGAREATVTLISDGSEQLRVIIADDGQGFIADTRKNNKTQPLGLTSMRERVEALGGTFYVNSQPGSGTQVTATIPMPQTRKEKQHAAPTTPAG
jgi:two-component system, NarL family, sensor histidine kinase DegS